MADRVVAGLHPVRELLRAGAPLREVRVAAGRSDRQVVSDIRGLAEAAGVPIVTSDARELDRLAGGVVHQGVVGLAPPFRYHDLDDVVTSAADGAPLLVAMDGVTDPHNVGSVARTAEAAGAHGLLLPARRSAAVTPVVEKAAAGALAYLPVCQVTNLTRALRRLGERGLWSVGLDPDGSTDVHHCALLEEPVVLVVGAEGRGLSRLVAETCDVLAAIGMSGRVASLNASVAAAIALYAARWRRSS